MGYNDPLVKSGFANEQRIKVTTGITALYRSRVHIDDDVCDLDVELRYPRGAAASKGWTVRPLKPYMI